MEAGNMLIQADARCEFLPGSDIVTDEQWKTLETMVSSGNATPLPVGFILDCPLLSAWGGVSSENIRAFVEAVRQAG